MLAQLHLEAREEVTCLNDVFLLGRHYIAVGTAIFPSDEEFDQFAYAGGSAVASKEGRLLLIEPVRNDSADRWDIKISRTLRTAGPVHDAKVIHGFLAVASTSKVGFRSLDFEGDRSFPQVSIHRLELNPPDLIELSAFSSAFITQYLHVASRSKLHNEDRLVVGDGMRSVFVLDVDEASGKIFGDQRDMATHSVTALEGIRDGGDGVVIADVGLHQIHRDGELRHGAGLLEPLDIQIEGTDRERGDFRSA